MIFFLNSAILLFVYKNNNIAHIYSVAWLYSDTVHLKQWLQLNQSKFFKICQINP